MHSKVPKRCHRLVEAPEARSVGRTPNTRGAAIEDMRVDHRGGDVPVPEQILDRADVIAVFQEMGGERVPEGMAGGGLRDSGSPNGAWYIRVAGNTHCQPS